MAWTEIVVVGFLGREQPPPPARGSGDNVNSLVESGAEQNGNLAFY